MNEAFEVVHDRIVSAIDALSGIDTGADNWATIACTETLLRRALFELSGRFGAQHGRPAARPVPLMGTLMLEAPSGGGTAHLPFKLRLPDLACDDLGRHQ